MLLTAGSCYLHCSVHFNSWTRGPPVIYIVCILTDNQAALPVFTLHFNSWASGLALILTAKTAACPVNLHCSMHVNSWLLSPACYLHCSVHLTADYSARPVITSCICCTQLFYWTSSTACYLHCSCISITQLVCYYIVPSFNSWTWPVIYIVLCFLIPAWHYLHCFSILTEHLLFTLFLAF